MITVIRTDVITETDDPSAPEDVSIMESLPSLYSPKPAKRPRNSSPIPDFTLEPNGHPHLASNSNQSALDYNSSETTWRRDVPTERSTHNLPSIISPAFTPPATPGSSSPSTSQYPRSQPVDSQDVLHGGCGSKQPRLLDELPDVECVARGRIPMTLGSGKSECWLHVYSNDSDNKEHIAIVFGENIHSTSLFMPRKGETEWDRLTRGAYYGRLYPGRATSQLTSSDGLPDLTPGAAPNGLLNGKASSPITPLVRIHSECYTGETAWSARCDCGEQLDEAARLMSLPASQGGGGVIVYLRQEGRGIGLGEKLKAYNLQDLGSDTVQANLLLRHPADARTYGLATAILVDLGLGGERGIRLLTNNPEKVRAVEGPKREVVVKEKVAMIPLAWRTEGKAGIKSPELSQYLRTKIEKMGHLLEPQ